MMLRNKKGEIMISKAYPLFITVLLFSSVLVGIGIDVPEITASEFPGTRGNEPFYRIDGDSELLSFASVTGSTGSGSAEDPLIICNVTIENYEGNCGILILETTLHLEIRNCSFSNISLEEGQSEEGGIGIGLEGCRYITIVDCNISYNLLFGLYLWGCSDISVINCSIDRNGLDGMIISYSRLNFINNNTFLDNGIYGIEFDHGSNIYIEMANNTFHNCGIGLKRYPTVNECAGTISETNLVNDKPIRVERDMTNGTISDDLGQLIMINCNSVNVEEVNLSNCSVGITLINCADISIRNCSVSGCEYGITGSCTDSIISDSEVFRNTNGMDIIGDNNAVASCNIFDNEVGFTCWGINCKIQGNDFSANDCGVTSTIDTGDWSIDENTFRDHLEEGISLIDYMGGADMGSANISKNIFINNRGSGINLLQTDRIYVFNNTFRGGGTGIDIYSWNSRFENNTFIGLDKQSISIKYCPDCVFKNNNMSGSGINHLSGEYYDEPDEIIIDQSNTLDGRPIYHSLFELNLSIGGVSIYV